MDDVSSIEAPDRFQEYQTQEPRQVRQIRTEPPRAEQQAFVPTPGTTVDEILKAAYFVAAGIDAPVVEVVNPHVINLHYPADGSLATVKVEARPGAWGGIQPISVDPMEANAHYDAMKAAAETAPPPEAMAERESHDDAHAREDSKPQEPREEERWS